MSVQTVPGTSVQVAFADDDGTMEAIFESKCVAMTSGATEFKDSTSCEALQKSQVLVEFMRALMTMSETPTFVVDTEKLSFWLAASMTHVSGRNEKSNL